MTHTVQPPLAWRQCAHDIKNIMATVSMVAEELAGEVSPRSRTLGLRLERSCVRVLEVCGTPSQRPIEANRYKLSAVLEDVAVLARGLSPQGLRISMKADRVNLDEETNAAVFRILANLATNSVQALNGSSGHLEICAQHEESKVMITVSDDGPGLGSTSFAGDTPGLPKRTGMGLTIARALATQIGGSLTLLHTGADGTSFLLSFPWTQAAPRDT